MADTTVSEAAATSKAAVHKVLGEAADVIKAEVRRDVSAAAAVAAAQHAEQVAAQTHAALKTELSQMVASTTEALRGEARAIVGAAVRTAAAELAREHHAAKPAVGPREAVEEQQRLPRIPSIFDDFDERILRPGGLWGKTHA